MSGKKAKNAHLSVVPQARKVKATIRSLGLIENQLG